MATWQCSNATQHSRLDQSADDERATALLLVGGHNHLTDGGDAVGLEEHVLGAAQADAFGTGHHRPVSIVIGKLRKHRCQDYK